MKEAGQVVLFQFPHANLASGKLRPALLLARLPGGYDDRLICMISSQLRHAIPDFDEVLTERDDDFRESGLHVPSVICCARLAVINSDILLGAIGNIGAERLQRIRNRLGAWLTQG